MRGKTVVITGATSGIGEEAAIRLAEQGARIVFIARDRVRADMTMAKLRQANDAAEHVFHIADLSRLSEMKQVAGDIAREPAIDVLINNAGALFNYREETPDGLERTFALNHRSYFVITNLLLRHLKPGARIVSTSSGAHRRAELDFSDLQNKNSYQGFAVYSKSKLCNILFTRELARRLVETGITANCLHPGFVATRFGDQSGGLISWGVRLAKPFMGLSTEEGARTIVHLASSPEVANVTGEYFYQCKPDTPSQAARDNAAARLLWDVSAEFARIS